MKSLSVVFLADETDEDDLDAVCSILDSKNVAADRCHPRELAFIGGPEGVVAFRRGEAFSPNLVVGWVYEDWLAPGMVRLESLQAAGVRVLNEGQTLFRGQNKGLMTALMHAAGVPHGSTWITWPNGFGAETPDAGQFPVVTKPGLTISAGHTVLSSGGGVTLVRGSDEWQTLRTVLDNLGHPLYAQSLVPSDARQGDLRVWVFGFEAVAAVRKVPARGEWITNVAHGGAIQLAHPLSEELVRVSELAARALGAPIAGVDLAEYGDSYIVFEVNTCPTFLPSKEVYGDLIPTKLADLIVKSCTEADVG